MILQLLDQDGVPFEFGGIHLSDTIVPGALNQLGIGTATGTATTDPWGQWNDHYSVCSTGCPSSGETDAAQVWTISVALPHVNTVAYKCNSIKIDGY